MFTDQIILCAYILFCIIITGGGGAAGLMGALGGEWIYFT